MKKYTRFPLKNQDACERHELPDKVLTAPAASVRKKPL